MDKKSYTMHMAKKEEKITEVKADGNVEEKKVENRNYVKMDGKNEYEDTDEENNVQNSEQNLFRACFERMILL